MADTLLNLYAPINAVLQLEPFCIKGSDNMFHAGVCAWEQMTTINKKKKIEINQKPIMYFSFKAPWTS